VKEGGVSPQLINLPSDTIKKCSDKSVCVCN